MQELLNLRDHLYNIYKTQELLNLRDHLYNIHKTQELLNLLYCTGDR
jgi:hypothetical protein